VLDARRIAQTVLLRVETGGAFANRALDAALSEAGRLDPRDTALATELVYGTLRRQIFIDHALSHFSRQPLPSLDPAVRVLLRMGAHQVLHLRMPERASVHATVELAKEIQRGRAVSYVNAVLRALGRERSHILIPPASVDPVGFLSLSESFPRWLVERLLNAHGFDATAALLASLNHPAPLTVRVNARRRDRAAAVHELKAAFGSDALPTRFSPVGLTVTEGRASVALLRPEDGAWQAQDEAAQLVSFFAAPSPGLRVLDACAAPGGKSCHMTELMENRGVIDAVDVHASRVREIEDAARKLGHTCILPRPADATLPLPFAPPEGYDLVLIDAPCTGLGTIRRHPELKTRRNQEDVGRLAELQRKLLENLAGSVRPGGILVYAVCTFTPEEGPMQIESFLRAHSVFRRERPPESAIAWADLLDPSGDLVIDPARHGTDAFYAARLRRT
jgi:16S rRNA (cytosine967-C5)-methyltransferase